MDSHEERVFVAVRQTQERDAKQKMREKAKELSKMQKTQQNERVKSIGGSSINALSSGINEIKLEQNVGDRAIGSSSSVPSMIRPKVCFLSATFLHYMLMQFKFSFKGHFKGIKIGLSFGTIVVLSRS